MNQRIRELAVEAGYIVGELPLNTNEKIQLAGLEKFAELLIRECVGLVNLQLQHNNPNDSLLALKIKEHFGVEE